MEIQLSNQLRLSEILKKKGIGPEASKSLKEEEIEEVKHLLTQEDISLTTKATFLTALLTLQPTEVEKRLIFDLHQTPEKFLTTELTPFITKSTSSDFLKIILKAISNTDLSKEEAHLAMGYFFDDEQPEYLKGAFLEAERLKRETFLENKVFFETMWNEIEHTELDVPVLIDIADSYDGCNRTRHFSVFVASLIASLGYPVYLHGIEKVAPKESVTANQILRAAGKNPLYSKEKVINDIQNPEIRWGYIDQSVFFPKLNALRQMRKEMVKRPFLATFEKLIQPIRAKNGNHIVTGYTHTHYREEVVNQLKDQGKCRQALVLKGVEGSTQISMSRETIAIYYDGKEIIDSTVHPSEFNLPVYSASRDMSITPEVSLQEGIEAFENKEGFALDNILYTASVMLVKLGLENKEDVVLKLKNSITTGKALKHWQNGAV